MARLAVPPGRWKATEIDKHSHYFCSGCGKECHSPAEVYSHVEGKCQSKTKAATKRMEAIANRGKGIASDGNVLREDGSESLDPSEQTNVSRASAGLSTYMDNSGRPTSNQKRAMQRDERYRFNPAYKKLSMVEQRALALEDPTDR